MKLWIKVLALSGITFTPLAILGVLQGGNLIPALSGQAGSASRGTEGDRRNEMLVMLTTRYVTQGRLVTMPMRNGAELAPIEFLNAELELAGVKWRVASVEGATAETYSIS